MIWSCFLSDLGFCLRFQFRCCCLLHHLLHMPKISAVETSLASNGRTLDSTTPDVNSVTASPELLIVVGPSWAHVGPTWPLCCALWGLCWAPLGPMLGHLAYVRPSWSNVHPSSTNLGASVGPSIATRKLPPTNCHQQTSTHKLPPTNCQTAPTNCHPPTTNSPLLCLVKL